MLIFHQEKLIPSHFQSKSGKINYFLTIIECEGYWAMIVFNMHKIDVTLFYII